MAIYSFASLYIKHTNVFLIFEWMSGHTSRLTIHLVFNGFMHNNILIGFSDIKMFNATGSTEGFSVGHAMSYFNVMANTSLQEKHLPPPQSG